MKEKKVTWGGSIINSCCITVIVEDTPERTNRGLLHKHGLAILIEASSENIRSKILFDTGPSPKEILRNMEILDVKLDDLNVILLSHGHYDHTGGLLGILNAFKDPMPVVIHPKIFHPKFAYKPNLQYIGPKFSITSIENGNGVLTPTCNPVTVISGILTSGEIPLISTFEKARGFWTVEDNQFVEDTMVDEQAVILNLRDKGLVVVAGCAHRGIVNTVQHAMKIFNGQHVHAIIGGFHLSKVNDKIIQKTVHKLESINPEYIYPCHCTGSKAIRKFEDVFGDKCRAVHTGDQIKI